MRIIAECVFNSVVFIVAACYCAIGCFALSRSSHCAIMRDDGVRCVYVFVLAGMPSNIGNGVFAHD